MTAPARPWWVDDVGDTAGSAGEVLIRDAGGRYVAGIDTAEFATPDDDGADQARRVARLIVDVVNAANPSHWSAT